jgi:hypothetical protein
MTSELKPPQTPQEALELALTLAATAPSKEKMLEAAKIAFEIMRSLPHEEVMEIMDTIDGRIDMLERAAFGDTIENLKTH